MGRISAEEADITLGATPANCDPEHRLMLVRAARQFRVEMDEEALYVATRQWWRIGADRMKLGTPRSPEWAMAVYKGVVRAVYKIERWEASLGESGRRQSQAQGSLGLHGQARFRDDCPLRRQRSIGEAARVGSESDPLRQLRLMGGDGLGMVSLQPMRSPLPKRDYFPRAAGGRPDASLSAMCTTS